MMASMRQYFSLFRCELGMSIDLYIHNHAAISARNTNYAALQPLMVVPIVQSLHIAHTPIQARRKPSLQWLQYVPPLLISIT